MHYYFLLLAYLATSLGFIGLGLVIFPFKKIHTWYKKTYRDRSSTTVSNRSEPILPSINLKPSSFLENNTPSLLFKEKVNHHIFSIFYLMAPLGEHYKGYVLWEALTSQKLKYGLMKIFHHYDDDTSTLFSVASALEPGYFDTDHIEHIKTPGLCLFMRNDTSAPLKTLDKMLKTAKRLEHLLGGKLCDYQRQPLSDITIQQYHQKLSSFHK